MNRLSLRWSLLLLAACSDYNFSPEAKPNGADDTGRGGSDGGSDGGSGETGMTDPPEDCNDRTFAAESVELLDECAFEPVIGTFTPNMEWAQPAPGDTYTTPAVGNLTDDNGDGLINADDVPDVVVSNTWGVTYALSGDDGRVLWATSSYATGSEPMSPAIGDLDNDGRPEVVSSGSGATYAFRGSDGSLYWSAGAYPGSMIGACGAVGIHDLDADGAAEVVIGRYIYEGTTGRMVGAGSYGEGSGHGWAAPMGVAADINRDGIMEVVTGNALYRKDGSIIWMNSQPDGFVAVGQFDTDPMGEIVVSYTGSVRLQDDDGTVLWTRAYVAGSTVGTPTVADFDGDGAPEIGVAGNGQYLVLDADGTTLWSRPTTDYSSGFTGSAVFDFEGDGQAEVVYADENSVWVFDGATGAVKMEETRHSSATCSEYPAVADVDNDGHAEIIYTSSAYSGGETGVRVIGDLDNSWRRGRPIWNQHAYSITNVNDDGTIPVDPDANWDSFNNFRSGDTNAGLGGAAPDLSARFDWVCGLECGEGRLIVYARVTNPGWADVETPISLELWGELSGSWTLLGTENVLGVASGEAPLPVRFEIPIDGGEEYTNLRLKVDGGNGAGVIDECDETNNERDWNEDVCR
jgi:hypothetical protein